MASRRNNTSRTNWALVGVSIIVAIGLLQYQPFHDFLFGLGSWGYLGIFIAGIFFAFTFTISTAIVVLLLFSQTIPAWEIGLIAGFGATVGDFFIFKFIKDHLIERASNLLRKFRKSPLTQVAKTRYFKWTLPILGAIIIASPFPDEIGMALLGIAKVKTYQFMILSFVLNVIGITLIAAAAGIAQIALSGRLIHFA